MSIWISHARSQMRRPMTLSLMICLASMGALGWIHLGVHVLYRHSRSWASGQGQRWLGCKYAAAHGIFRGPTVAPNLASPSWKDPEKSADPSGLHARSAAVLEYVHESPPIAVGEKRKGKRNPHENCLLERC